MGMIFGPNVQTQQPDIPKTTTLVYFKTFKLSTDTMGQQRGGFPYKISSDTANSMNNHTAKTLKKNSEFKQT